MIASGRALGVRVHTKYLSNGDVKLNIVLDYEAGFLINLSSATGVLVVIADLDSARFIK